MLEDHAAILVTGPRATGKSTSCARRAHTVLNLGDRAVAEALAAGADAVLSGRDEPVLIDEWQVVPDVLQVVKTAVDRQPDRGRFIVTGSVDQAFDERTWPGTGRLVGLSMFGLTERELAGQVGTPSWLAQLLAGGEAPAHRSDTGVDEYVERALRSGSLVGVIRGSCGHSRRPGAGTPA